MQKHCSRGAVARTPSSQHTASTGSLPTLSLTMPPGSANAADAAATTSEYADIADSADLKLMWTGPASATIAVLEGTRAQMAATTVRLTVQLEPRGRDAVLQVIFHEELAEDGADAVAERRHEHDRERPRVLPKRGRRQWLRSENARGGAHEERGEEVREASPPSLASALPRVSLHHPAVVGVGRSLVRAAL